MKSVKRCVKFDQKFDDNSTNSYDRQGMYYQFMIERKVPNGILRHIASNEDVVVYEFIHKNYEGKRRKLNESIEPNSELLISKNKEVKSVSKHTSGASLPDQHDQSGSNLKIESENKDLSSQNKSTKLSIKNRIRSNLNLDYNKPCMYYKSSNNVKSKDQGYDKLSMKKTISHGQPTSSLPLLKHSKSSLAYNLKIQNKNSSKVSKRGRGCYQK